MKAKKNCFSFLLFYVQLQNVEHVEESKKNLYVCMYTHSYTINSCGDICHLVQCEMRQQTGKLNLCWDQDRLLYIMLLLLWAINKHFYSWHFLILLSSSSSSSISSFKSWTKPPFFFVAHLQFYLWKRNKYFWGFCVYVCMWEMSILQL